ncbi:protein of unknown function [Magnetospirillum sp. XM-1]|nr:protein of unknown function [Magnetospirillum sp. XM-1]
MRTVTVVLLRLPDNRRVQAPHQGNAHSDTHSFPRLALVIIRSAYVYELLHIGGALS